MCPTGNITKTVYVLSMAMCQARCPIPSPWKTTALLTWALSQVEVREISTLQMQYLRNNCIVFEEFVASIRDLMVANNVATTYKLSNSFKIILWFLKCTNILKLWGNYIQIRHFVLSDFVRHKGNNSYKKEGAINVSRILKLKY